MGAFIAKQPNCKYCRFSTVIDSVTHYNMSENDYIEMCAERAREEAREVLTKHVKPFADVKRYFLPTNNTVEEFNVMLREMGETELLEDPKDFE